MLEGSSALHYEGTKQVVSPRIRASMYLNDYANIVGVSNAHSVGSVTNFNGYHLLVDTNRVGTGGATVYAYGYTNGGLQFEFVSGIGTIPVEAYSTNDLVTRFYNSPDGATLAMFRLFHSGGIPGIVTDSIDAIYSTGATAWGGTESIATVGEFIVDIAPVSYDCIYYLQVSDSIEWFVPPGGSGLTTFYYTSSVCDLCKVEYSGSTWQRSTIAGNFVVAEDGAENGSPYQRINPMDRLSINARRVDNFDYILLRSRRDDQPYSEPTQESFGIRLIKTDGTNILGEKDIVDTRAPIPRMFFSDISYGASTYYFTATYTERVESIMAGNTIITVSDDQHVVFESPDMWHWSIGKHITGTSWGNRSTGYNPVFAGLSGTNEKYSVMGSSVNAFVVNNSLGSSGFVDISDDIIAYQNQNNDRVQITLGNFDQ